MPTQGSHMAVYEREVYVEAPFDEVWAFHSTVDGLREVTPDWVGLRVEWVEGPDGERDPEVLSAGSTLRLSVRPFGVGSRRGWVSQIAAREETEGSAYFRDEMRQGPFRRWDHTHSCFADGTGTLVRDRVEFESPLGPGVDEILRMGFEPLFRDRHRRTKRRLEGATAEETVESTGVV